MEERPLLHQITGLKDQKNWKALLRLSQEREAFKFLWAWPGEGDLLYLKGVLRRHRVVGVTSVGCGCGLLEWLIQEVCGVPVEGIEINRKWWESKHSATPFIPLKYADEGEGAEPPRDNALLFCYFNNGQAFRDYMAQYKGSLVVIIGPHEGSGRHTDPQPFNPDFGVTKWRLEDCREIKNTRDFIAVYTKDL